MPSLARQLSSTASLALVAAAVGATSAAASTIRSVATATWLQSGRVVEVRSNSVDVEARSSEANVTAYRIATGRDAPSEAVAAPRCAGRRPGAEVSDAPSLAFGPPVDAIEVGEPFLFKLSFAAANRDPDRVDAVEVTVDVRGDRETLTVSETGANTGVFGGYLPTSTAPATAVSGDCVLTAAVGEDRVALDLRVPGGDAVVARARSVGLLIDPYGAAFDSGDGSPVNGVAVTIVEADTGRPAQVFGDDGRSAYPSTVVTGQAVRDAGGTEYPMREGDYRFPLLAPGRYRLQANAPRPYSAPSKATPEQLALILGPSGRRYAVAPGSFGGVITLSEPAPVRVDIPLDRPAVPVTVEVSASTGRASPGDVVIYTATIRNAATRTTRAGAVLADTLPVGMRLRPDSVRVDGVAVPNEGASPADGREVEAELGPLAPGQVRIVRYAAEVRADAAPGNALNRVRVRDADGLESGTADALVRIERDAIADRATVQGQVLLGGCDADPRRAEGLPGVRVFMEDGRYAITDRGGRYHFEGVLPGTHVVQIDPAGLPAGHVANDCRRNVRSGGSAISRFLEGGGGALHRADFHVVAPAGQTVTKPGTAAPAASRSLGGPASDREAAGSERDWFAGQTPGVEWLFPEPDHNPRAGVVRVAIKHLPGQSVALRMAGRPVDPMAFDGSRTSADGVIAISLWRGVVLAARDNELTAEVRDKDGRLVRRLTRQVHFAAGPMRAELSRERSRLVADGVTRPRIALRLTDRDGRPVRHGLTGGFTVSAPYRAAVEVEAQQARQLVGLERARPGWRVEGDDGWTILELEPTSVSGAVVVELPFQDGQVSRVQRVEAWLDAGERPWTVVGFAAGTVGFDTLTGRLEAGARGRDELAVDGRIALYARGRVLGRWLMTLAYDSDKRTGDTRFGGVIDPQAYYTVYADRSEQRFDANSVRRLYLRLEAPQFQALFGDYVTGINEPQLARYNRAFNGVRAEYRGATITATGFAADSPNRHRRDELQGSGLSGPYQLGARDILPNSEQVVIETRDRLRSDRIVERRTLARHVDYDVDHAAGTLRFKEPILSRSSALDPQFVVVDYETQGIASRMTSAGGRATWAAGERLRLGATAISDQDERRATRLGGVDLRYRPNVNTELRAEFAASAGGRAEDGVALPTSVAAERDGLSTAWLAEVEHHGSRYDLLAYVRRQDGGFGVGQLNRVEAGTRKLGLDGRVRLLDGLEIDGSGWREEVLFRDTVRNALRGQLTYRTGATSLRAGLTHAADRIDGRALRSTIAQLGASRRFFDNELEIDAQTEFALGSEDDSVDFPARRRLGVRYAITTGINLVGSYEVAHGEALDARTARLGFDVLPWAGGRVSGALNQQDIAEYGPRSFAAFGLSQSLRLSERWSIDASVDGNRTLGGIDPATVVNPGEPVASGGFLGSGGLTEDFAAVTLGASFRSERWSWTGRAEYRVGDQGARKGLTSAILRHVGEGSALGASLNWFRAERDGGVRTDAAALALSWAHRPQSSRWSWLNKLELRSDAVENAVLGEPGPIGGVPLAVGGDLSSRRVVNSLSLNYSPTSRTRDGRHLDRHELSLFWGSRYASDAYGTGDVRGWSNLLGLDGRLDLGERLDVGGSVSVRQGADLRSISYAGGPQVGVRPFDSGWVSVGWNVIGFHDRDYFEARYTRSGPYVTTRLKFDQSTLAGLRGTR